MERSELVAGLKALRVQASEVWYKLEGLEDEIKRFIERAEAKPPPAAEGARGAAKIREEIRKLRMHARYEGGGTLSRIANRLEAALAGGAGGEMDPTCDECGKVRCQGHPTRGDALADNLMTALGKVIDGREGPSPDIPEWEAVRRAYFALKERADGFGEEGNPLRHHVAGLEAAMQQFGGDSGEAQAYAEQLKAFLNREWPDTPTPGDAKEE
jgi:hypothetical protein